MANPNFVPDWSTNQVYVDLDDTVCLTDTLYDMQDDIDGKALASHTHSEYASSSHTHTEYASTSHEHSAYANATHTHSEYAPTSHTHSDYANATHTHTEYASTSHEHSGYAVGTHNHDTDYIKKALQFTNDNGDVKENISGTDVLATIGAKATGVYTFYSDATSTNKPKSNIGWRYLVHKTNVNYAWVIAFGSEGSVFTNYLHNGTWSGWRCIHDSNPTPLWTGSLFMGGDHTATPTKKLSDCNNGWILVWSDYDDDTSTVNSYDQCTCVIPKKNAMGTNWNGEGYMCVLPWYSDDNGTNDSIAIKNINVYDNRLVGKDKNKAGSGRRDVVLRAIYEF